ncbi:MAG: polysaccharide biosynthesis protein PslG [Thermoleophilaceae bacterium]|nr:polysaccharide biosynthesis protein PslG [Thermoleophilaceae bacterium]
MRRFAATVVALTCVMAVAAAPASAKRSVPQGFYGVDFDRDATAAAPSIQDAMWGTMAQTGVESARVIFDWRSAQPSKDQPPSFAVTDRAVAYAAAHGIRVLPVVMLAPPWARVLPDKQESAPSDIPAYTDYLRALVARYGPSGSFWSERPSLPRLPVRDWQVWNEPDLPYQWQPRENWPARYGDLLRAGAAALRQADPGARVVMAALTNSSWVALGQLYDSGGIAGSFDAVALNVYTVVPGHITEILRRGRKVMDQNGGKTIPIWVTELGASASKGRLKPTDADRHLQTTDARLAHLVTRAYDLLAAKRNKLGVGRAYWYTWASTYDTHSGGIFDFAGLTRFRLGTKPKAKPALAAYRKSARSHEGCSKNTRGTCGR